MKDSTEAWDTVRVLYVGLDVHKDTIAVAVAEGDGGEVRTLGTIANDPDALRGLMRRLGPTSRLRVCYEAGPCGYDIQRRLARMGAECVVVAPSLVPTKPGDRVKTDRRDAIKLARLLRSGELTPVWVPDEEHEALRDLVRAREDAHEDLVRARHRLTKLVLRLGHHAPIGVKAWTVRHRQWVEKLRLGQPGQQIVLAEYLHAVDEAAGRIERLEKEIETLGKTSAHAAVIAALQAMRGVALITAVTFVAELGDLSRFSNPRELMAYAGMVPTEHSSGQRRSRGSITKTGNAHVRRVAIEAAWHYRHAPALGANLKRRQQGIRPKVCAIAWKGQHRLHNRYRQLMGRNMTKQKAIVAIARELLGFAWAIAREVREAG